MRVVLATVAVLAFASACETSKVGGPRPPQGSGPAGTLFGFWERDAEGAVDASFRAFIVRTYDAGDEVKARAALTKDGFTCKDGNRPDGAPVPTLDCQRLFQQGENVHAWTVKFWPNQREPEAHFSSTYLRDPTRVFDDRRSKN